MSIRDHYPEGTDMSYFDIYDTTEDIECPNCGVKSQQLVWVDGDHYSTDAECPECEYSWEEEWYKEPEFREPDDYYYEPDRWDK